MPKNSGDPFENIWFGVNGLCLTEYATRRAREARQRRGEALPKLDKQEQQRRGLTRLSEMMALRRAVMDAGKQLKTIEPTLLKRRSGTARSGKFHAKSYHGLLLKLGERTLDEFEAEMRYAGSTAPWRSRPSKALLEALASETRWGELFLANRLERQFQGLELPLVREEFQIEQAWLQAEAPAAPGTNTAAAGRSSPRSKTSKPIRKRKRTPRTEMTEKQVFVYELHRTARLSFPKIAREYKREYHRNVTGEAMRRMYQRALKVKANKGHSIQSRLPYRDQNIRED